MEILENNNRFCQSCGVFLGGIVLPGTNVDGSINRDYCYSCLFYGEFTEPSLTKEEMIKRVSKTLLKLEGLKTADSRKEAIRLVSSLLRWKTSS